MALLEVRVEVQVAAECLAEEAQMEVDSAVAPMEALEAPVEN